jgi:hypothetical protein
MIAQVRTVLQDCLIACIYVGREKLAISDLVAIAVFSPVITFRWSAFLQAGQYKKRMVFIPTKFPQDGHFLLL